VPADVTTECLWAIAQLAIPGELQAERQGIYEVIVRVELAELFFFAED
jgi:hypothetical protein